MVVVLLISGILSVFLTSFNLISIYFPCCALFLRFLFFHYTVSSSLSNFTPIFLYGSINIDYYPFLPIIHKYIHLVDEYLLFIRKSLKKYILLPHKFCWEFKCERYIRSSYQHRIISHSLLRLAMILQRLREYYLELSTLSTQPKEMKGIYVWV